MAKRDLKQVRAKLGLSQERMAKLMGIHINHVARIETGNRKNTRVAQLIALEILHENGLIQEFKKRLGGDNDAKQKGNEGV